MKVLKSILYIAIWAFVAISCSDNDEILPPKNETLAFEGTFMRKFNAQGVVQTVTYKIEQEKITYRLSGGLAQADYEMKKEYYSSEEHRWIGVNEKNGTFYVLFFKNVKGKELSIYKKEIESVEEGKEMAIPAVDDTDNYGWNTYKKNSPISGKIENLHAPAEGRGTYTGKFTKFSFKEGKQVDGDNWDIAFRATEIIVNGGKKGKLLEDIDRTKEASMALLSKRTFESLVEVPSDVVFKQDAIDELAIPTGSNNGWYTYTLATHSISPIAGKVILVKTIDGNYAKLEILSYYKDKTFSQESSRYYTFNYVYNPIKGDKNFQ
ncbi:heme binding lipoprotein precursor HmuY-family [Tenacibaculum maritimum]|uniref:HmuY family protein n=1 Tax=Tenacibaculum maritimum TaxID=107401 RepID=UPI0012E4D665|nr:HmuY family protein [Tenacibaculum maritimum]CAA0169059.1 heme binding lipoprotein precursor HmuY-family [Tenacibaculum maritimum]